MSAQPIKPVSVFGSLLYATCAVASFHAAYLSGNFQWAIWVYLFCLFRLAWLATARQAIWFGMAIGLAAYSPHLAFFWNLFGSSAIALWCVLSFWLAMFLVIGRAWLYRFGPMAWALAAPFFWTGLEYFRSELYYLRFSWLNAGYAFSTSANLPLWANFGVYGIGFVLMAWAAWAGVAAHLSMRTRSLAALALAAITAIPVLVSSSQGQTGKTVNITGVQLEFPLPSEALLALSGALKKYPKTDMFVLSEYAFDGPVPPMICQWCKQHHKWLVAGGKKPVSPIQFYNMVFVIGADGKVAFEQAKCVPVQFLKDGLPASEQRLWDSPWGKLGFGVCYDASYTRVTDELVRQGAQALIFPTMDTVDWGKAEHELHGRIAPMRAAEYAVPVFRLCSSGISQVTDRSGRVLSFAPFPGPDALLNADVQLPARGRIPPDRWLAWISVGVTAAAILYLLFDCVTRRKNAA